MCSKWEFVQIIQMYTRKLNIGNITDEYIDFFLFFCQTAVFVENIPINKLKNGKKFRN